MATATIPFHAPTVEPTKAGVDADINFLRTQLAEGSATMQVNKVTATGYRINWLRPQKTTLAGFEPLRIYKSLFVMLEHGKIVIPERQ